MSRINVGRLVLGGFVAGIIANALDFVTAQYLMADEMSEMASRLNLSQAVMDESMWTWITVDLIWGFLLVFAYAGMRPRFGPGPKTAVITGIVLWLSVTIMFAGLTAMGIFTQAAFMKSAVCALASTLIAVLVGAAIYKE